MENPETTLQGALRRGGNACRECGKPSLRLTPKGRLSKICSDACKDRRSRAQTAASMVRLGLRRAEPFPARRCVHCAVEFTPLKGDHVACSRKCRVRVKIGYLGPQERDCAHCKTRFTTKARQGNIQLYCTKRCTVAAYRAANPEKVAEWSARGKPRAAAREASRRAARPPERPLVACRVCARSFEGAALATICSQECRLRDGRERARAYDEQRRLSRIEEFAAECAECSRPFTYESQSGTQDRKHCSGACGDAAARHLRNARVRRKAPGVDHPADKVVRYGWIRKRDNWTCQCCGIRTPRGAIATPDAPELDHVIPLARGGFHQAGNLWLLCRACNQAKGARDPLEFAVAHLAGHPTALAACIARIGRVLSALEV